MSWTSCERRCNFHPFLKKSARSRPAAHPVFTNQNTFDTNDLLLQKLTSPFERPLPPNERGESECNATPAPLPSCQANSPCNIYVVACLFPRAPELVHPPSHHPSGSVHRFRVSRRLITRQTVATTHFLHFPMGNDRDYFCANSAYERLP